MNKMNESLHLHIPAYEELGYRQKLMADPDTMSYNKGYDMDLDGYDRQTGCMSFPEREWADWYAYFVGNEPKRFYAYVVRDSDGAFIGEVNVHQNPGAPYYDMGIVLEARYRGMGHAVPALRLLLRHAFEEMGATAIHNDFEETRVAAVKTHLAAGFTVYKRENGIVKLMITREQYEKQRGRG